ncbi:MAG: hypothetical protein IJV55_04895 [Paludibacteraceae bacterium]|nr:hypothetical protein [Paludibacteraceae bacterium]MBQ9705509.1 hypothetical protein [Paludibacteraceae bacterium]
MKIMKKAMLLLAVATALLSCAGRDGRDGKDGRDGRDGLVNYASLDYIVSADSKVSNIPWQYTGDMDNNYFVAELAVPELTGDVFDNGVVQVSIVYNFNTADERQTHLPCTVWYEEDVDGQYVSHAEHYYFEYRVGTIYVYFQASDFGYTNGDNLQVPLYTPHDTHFHVMMMW